MRGVSVYSGEATVAGSPFMDGNIPRFQVEILIPGLLLDDFVGYGCRIEDYLVMPGHVYDLLPKGEFLMKTAHGKALVKPTVLRSAVINDIVYLMVETRVWTDLGISKPSVGADVPRAVTVTVSGRKGKTVGTIAHSRIKFLYNYTGSTLPGYSGAGYVHNGSLMGVHLGVAGSGNIGACAEVLLRDIKALLKGEAGVGTAISANFDRELIDQGRRSADWRTSDYDKDIIDEDDVDAWEIFEEWSFKHPSVTFDDYMLEKKGRRPRYTNGSRHVEIDGESAHTFRGLTPNDLEKMSVLVAMEKKRRSRLQAVPIVGQSDESPVFNLAVDEVAELRQRVQVLESEIQNLKGQVEVLNLQAKKPKLNVQTQQPTKKTISCAHPGCAKKFGTNIGLITHKFVVHSSEKMSEVVEAEPDVQSVSKATIATESVFPSDSQKLIATDPKNVRKSSGNPSSTNFSKNLTLSAKSVPSTSRQDNQSKMSSLENRLDKLCATLEKVLVGLQGTQET
uniref:C2H2-type domain-containing protein n=1 Tax=Riboviria sp. TaxID=2585031 RepID=A0A8K1U2I2_9VIRU|nr:MAG: hypothetical protein 2 [Riboviria sp.]